VAVGTTADIIGGMGRGKQHWPDQVGYVRMHAALLLAGGPTSAGANGMQALSMDDHQPDSPGGGLYGRCQLPSMQLWRPAELTLAGLCVCC
jgi:hypothetical protein